MNQLRAFKLLYLFIYVFYAEFQKKIIFSSPNKVLINFSTGLFYRFFDKSTRHLLLNLLTNSGRNVYHLW